MSSKKSTDLYSFSLRGRSSFKLALSKLQDNVDVFLVQGQRTVASSRKAGKKADAIATTLEAGTYTIRVERRRGASKYQLRLSTAQLPLPSLPPVSRRFLGTTDSAASTVSLATGAVSPFASSNLIFFDIASFGDNTLLGITSDSLYRIDSGTGATTLVGGLGTPGVNMNGLGFDPSGTLYATGSSGFYRVDQTTGRATLVSAIPGFASSGDLAYDAPSGRFFATSQTGLTDQLFSIGTQGDARLVGNIGFNGVFGLLIDNNTLYGYTSDRRQIVINPVTGAGTFDRLVTNTTAQIFGAT